jgi:diguanylate cyclase (GGDEF)-like protein
MPHSYGQAFLSRPAARPQRLAAMFVGAVLLAATAVLGSHASLPTIILPGLTPAWLVTLCLAQGFTGLLLGLQASHLRHPTLALLAGAYTFTFALNVLQLMGTPGVFSLQGWFALAPLVPWLNLVSHFFFPLWALLAVWQLNHSLQRGVLWVAWLVPTLLGPVAVGVLHWAGPWLPALLEDHTFLPLLTHAAMPLNAVELIVVMTLMVWQTRMRTRLHLWLAVVLMAQLCEVALTVFADGPSTIGGVGAQCLSACASVILLGALLWDIHDIHLNLQRMNARLHDHATFDQLTGALMRRPFYDQLGQALDERAHKGTSCAVLMFDVDHFKAFNDDFGHMAGDVCLTTVADAVLQVLPKQGAALGRLGGEEFAVLLVGKEAQRAPELAENVRLAVLRQRLPHARSSGLAWVTISVGWGQAMSQQTAEQLVERADQALYRAKRGGRNQVCGDESTETPTPLLPGPAQA